LLVANALSEVGRVRKDNEDNYLVSTERGLFVVADGMGGHAGGEVASSIVKRVLDEEIGPPLVDLDCEKVLLNALIKANDLILRQGQDRACAYFGMGTTVTAAIFQAEKLYVAHIGDSRAYLFREGCLHLLTQDHSLVNELLQKGELTPEEAENHPRRNILTRALGINEKPQIDVLNLSVQKGDLLLLCTDGLYNQVYEEELADNLSGEGLLKVKVEKMVNLALERGGNDNITAVLVQYA
jgi:serine/threonine protein phosphatase PrpC